MTSTTRPFESQIIVDFYDDERPDPAGGDAYYYMVRGRNTCGLGTFGTASECTSISKTIAGR